MKLEVHVLTHDDEQMLVWALRHYLAIGARVVVHDGGPRGLSSEIAKVMGAEARPWDTAGQLNDSLARHLKNTCWEGTDADWVACMDADELLYFPIGMEVTLRAYDKMGAAVPKPGGFEMLSDEWFDPRDHADQIYDHVKDGAPDDHWYAKPVLFSPARVADSGFGIGAHESEPVLHGGRTLRVGRDWPKANPPCWLLHFHQIGGLERIAKRYDETRKRLSGVNVKNGWGNFDTGLVHAQAKRDLILPKLTRVIA